MEQYPTSPQLAAAVVLMAVQQGDLGPHTTACDLGCGTGMLGIAAALVETDHVLGVDCDAGALMVSVENAQRAEVDDRMDFVQARVKDLTAAEAAATENADNKTGARGVKGGGRGRGGRGRDNKGRGRSQKRSNLPKSSTTEARQLILSDDDGLPLVSKCVDTVLTNPPFGTKANAGMDLRFLRTATRLSRRAVYSFHKTSTREFLIRQVQGNWGMKIQIMAEMRFDLPQTYKFHQRKSVDVQVDLIRVLVDENSSVIALGGPSGAVGCGAEAEETDDDPSDNEEE